MDYVYLINEKRFFKNRHQQTILHGIYKNFEDAKNRMSDLTKFECSYGPTNYVQFFVDNSLEYARNDVTNDLGKHVELEIEKEKVL